MRCWAGYANRAASFRVLDHLGVQIKNTLEVSGGKDLVRRAAGDDLAVSHHHQVVGVGGGQVQVVEDQ